MIPINLFLTILNEIEFNILLLLYAKLILEKFISFLKKESLTAFSIIFFLLRGLNLFLFLDMYFWKIDLIASI